MDAPPVQYVKTRDGYDIAYTVCGAGATVIVPPLVHNHVQLNWHNDAIITRRTRLLRRLSQRFRVIAYDNRGQGMSSRGLRDDLTLRHFDLDTEAVVEGLGIDDFAFVACARAGHLAIRYAAAHPERVSALALISCTASMQKWPSGLFDVLASQNWDFFLRTQLHSGLPPEQVNSGIAMLKQTSTAEDYAVTWRVWNQSNVSELLDVLRTPTLVVHPRDFPLLPVEESMQLAARIPGARLVVVNGSDIFGEADQTVQAIDAFLADLPGSDEHTLGKPVVGLPAGLSEREIEVLRLLARGMSNPEIAQELVISVNTVNRHVSNTYAKLGVESRAQAAVYAKEHGLV